MSLVFFSSSENTSELDLGFIVKIGLKRIKVELLKN